MTMQEANLTATPEVALPALRDALLRQVRPRVACEADAEDVVRDLLVRLWDQRDGLGDVRNLEHFVRRAASNAIRDHHRRTGARGRATERLGDEARPDDGDPAVLAAASQTPDGPFDRDLLVACMRPFLGGLPPIYREALELTDVGGMSQRDAAARLGLSPTGMRSRVQRGRALLKSDLLACCLVATDGRGRAVAATPRDPCGGR